jgi:hypothetical protein
VSLAALLTRDSMPLGISEPSSKGGMVVCRLCQGPNEASATVGPSPSCKPVLILGLSEPHPYPRAMLRAGSSVLGSALPPPSSRACIVSVNLADAPGQGEDTSNPHPWPLFDLGFLAKLLLSPCLLWMLSYLAGALVRKL